MERMGRLAILSILVLFVVASVNADEPEPEPSDDNPCHGEEPHCENGGTCLSQYIAPTSAEPNSSWIVYCTCPFGTGGSRCQLEIEHISKCDELPDLRSCLTAELGCGWCVPSNLSLAPSCSEFDVCAGDSVLPRPLEPAYVFFVYGSICCALADVFFGRAFQCVRRSVHPIGC